MAVISTGSRLMVFGFLLFFVSSCAATVDLNALLEKKGPILDAVKKQVLEVILGEAKVVAKDFQDPSQLAELLEKLNSLNSTIGIFEEDGLSCTLYNLVGDDCFVSFKMRKLEDMLTDVLENLGKVEEVTDLLQAVLLPLLVNPCACAPFEISDGCHKLVKKAFDGFRLLC